MDKGVYLAASGGVGAKAPTSAHLQSSSGSSAHLPQIATCAARPVSKLLGDDLLAKTRMSNRKPTKFVIAQSSSPNNLPRGTIQT